MADGFIKRERTEVGRTAVVRGRDDDSETAREETLVADRRAVYKSGRIGDMVAVYEGRCFKMAMSEML